MERAKAIAIAAAVAMSLTSGVIALGANVGALGFGGLSNAGTATRVSVVTATSGVRSKTENRLQPRENDDTSRATELRADGAANTKGQDHG